MGWLWAGEGGGVRGSQASHHREVGGGGRVATGLGDDVSVLRGAVACLGASSVKTGHLDVLFRSVGLLLSLSVGGVFSMNCATGDAR
ncbi:hypothetical protein CgunFtcFv8_019084 [Champsocephalus gunnari]|uniref:Uncharacterized protein n=1 Tax=Champsocephalus gunnari TaxID=52237 RepID=A0AAN8DPC8_CHAGU|nr:hypothetical protein CgunFtcFv8_019084 [Champsocephalus gunnari]